MTSPAAPAERFSDRAQAYAVARPGYPPQIATELVRAFALPRDAVVYARVRHRHAHHQLVAAFFGHAGSRELQFSNPTRLDFDTLVQRLDSASYVPKAGTTAHAPMLAALRQLFDATQRDGCVSMIYTTRVFFGEAGAR